MSDDIKHYEFKTYFSLFLIFICTTLTSYFVVVEKLFSIPISLAIILACATFQAVFQLGVFLDLFIEPKPRKNLQIFLLMVVILLTVFIGSLWIMFDLNDRNMPMMEMKMPQEGI
jgi:cytochrome o ubiquinol oxidase operon protein cyoD